MIVRVRFNVIADGDDGAVHLFRMEGHDDTGWRAPVLFSGSDLVPGVVARQAPRPGRRRPAVSPAAAAHVQEPLPFPAPTTAEPEQPVLDIIDEAPAPLIGLDPDQRTAATVGDGPSLITGGPGTGKTRTLTRRIAYLVSERGVPPEQFLVIMFTRNAAAEMTEQLVRLLGSRAESVTVTTFTEFGHDVVGGLGHEAAAVELLESRPGLAEYYRRRFAWICVDEYQDVDAVQHRLLRLLALPDANLTVVGDPDQAIRGRSNADVSAILRFQEDYPAARVTRLTRNHRSGAHILAGAMQVVRPSTLTPGRMLFPVDDGSEPAKIGVHHAADEHAEAAFVSRTVDQLLSGSLHTAGSGRDNLTFADIAVLYRSSEAADTVADALTRGGYPVQWHTDDAGGLGSRANRISLLTLHAAKGSEFAVVFIVGCEDRPLPFRRPGSRSDDHCLAEERRLFFVGMTRARWRLYLTHARRRRLQGRTCETRPSPFLGAIDTANVDRSGDVDAPEMGRTQQLTLM